MKSILFKPRDLVDQKYFWVGFPLILISIGFFLRILNIGGQSLWLDEVLTFNDAIQPLPSIFRSILASPPLYHYLTHAVLQFCGHSELCLRLPSLLIGCVTLPIYFLISKSLFGREISLIALSILVVSPFHIVYSQEARMYSLLFLLSIFVIFFWIRALAQDRSLDWALFSLTSLLGLYTHNWFVFLVVFQGTFSLIKAALRKSVSANAIISFMAIGLLYLPWIPILIEQSQKPVFGHMRAPSLMDIREMFYAFSGIRVPSGDSWIGVGRDARLPILLSTTALFVRGVFHKNSGCWKNSVLFLACFVFPLLATLLVSWIYKPIFAPGRYPIMFLPVFIWFLAIGIESLKLKYLSMLLPALIVLYCLYPLAHYYRGYHKAPWKEIAEWIDTNTSSETCMRTGEIESAQIILKHYLPGDRANLFDRPLADCSQRLQLVRSERLIDEGSEHAGVPIARFGDVSIVRRGPP